MTTTITIQGRNFTIPNDKVSHIISLLEAYKVIEHPQQQVREVLNNNPHNDGRTLING